MYIQIRSADLVRLRFFMINRVFSSRVSAWHRAVFGLLVGSTLLQLISLLCFIYVLLNKGGRRITILSVVLSAAACKLITLGVLQRKPEIRDIIVGAMRI